MDLALGTGKLEDKEPITVGKLFQDTVARIPNIAAMKYKIDGNWREIIYSDYYQMVIQAAKSFIKVSIKEDKLLTHPESYEFVCVHLFVLFVCLFVS